MTTEEIRDRLFKIKDDGYKAFHSKLIPTVNPDKIIGVRTPDLRKFTSEIYKSGEYEKFSPEYPDIVADVKSDEYYVNMAAAWYFATALSKRYGEIVPYIENKTLSVWVHNKTIRKAVESYRITPEQKKYLRTLIIK